MSSQVSQYGVQKFLVHHSLPNFKYNAYNEKHLIKIKTALQLHCIAKEKPKQLQHDNVDWSASFSYRVWIYHIG